MALRAVHELRGYQRVMSAPLALARVRVASFWIGHSFLRGKRSLHCLRSLINFSSSNQTTEDSPIQKLLFELLKPGPAGITLFDLTGAAGLVQILPALRAKSLTFLAADLFHGQA